MEPAKSRQQHPNLLRILSTRPAANSADESQALGEVLPQAFKQPEKSVVDRLALKFGWGQDKAKRLKLYVRIERLVKLHGEPVLQIISEVVAESVSARTPAHYFCWSIKRRLKENGFNLSAGSAGEGTW